MLLTACSTAPSPTAAISPGTATAGRTGPVISPPPVTPPTPPGDLALAFNCTDAKGGSAASVHVTDVRVTQEDGFDRFVIQFDGNVPAFTIHRQSKPVFTQGAGQTITLSGTVGVLVQLHTATGSGTYEGPTDFTQAGFRVLKEARLTQDADGTVAWGLGLGTTACMRVFQPAISPSRLIIDFATTSS